MGSNFQTNARLKSIESPIGSWLKPFEKEAPQWVSEMKNRTYSKILITFYTLIRASNNICSETLPWGGSCATGRRFTRSRRPLPTQLYADVTQWHITGQHIPRQIDGIHIWSAAGKWDASSHVITLWAFFSSNDPVKMNERRHKTILSCLDCQKKGKKKKGCGGSRTTE